MMEACDFHPIAGRFTWERDWDVVYDPPETVLHHEIFGHIIPKLRNMKVINAPRDHVVQNPENECDALEAENRYRRQIKRREIQPELTGCPSP